MWSQPTALPPVQLQDWKYRGSKLLYSPSLTLTRMKSGTALSVEVRLIQKRKDVVKTEKQENEVEAKLWHKMDTSTGSSRASPPAAIWGLGTCFVPAEAVHIYGEQAVFRTLFRAQKIRETRRKAQWEKITRFARSCFLRNHCRNHGKSWDPCQDYGKSHYPCKNLAF